MFLGLVCGVCGVYDWDGFFGEELDDVVCGVYGEIC